MITFQELEKAEVSDLPLRKRTEAFFSGTRALSQFAKQVMVPVLTGQVSPSDKEKALVGIYLRMCGWMYSLVAMNWLYHIQGIAAGARSLFELLLDIKTLADDTTGALVNQFHAFVEVARFRSARRTVFFKDAHKNLVHYDDTPQRALLSTPNKEQHINELVMTHWGKDKHGKPKWPDHWTGKNAYERAEALGAKYEELYVRTYAVLSWYIHGGSVCYAGVDVEAFENGFSWCHILAQASFLEATEICAREMKIEKIQIGDHTFEECLEILRLEPGKVLVAEQIKLLEEAKAKGAPKATP